MGTVISLTPPEQPNPRYGPDIADVQFTKRRAEISAYAQELATSLLALRDRHPVLQLAGLVNDFSMLLAIAKHPRRDMLANYVLAVIFLECARDTLWDQLQKELKA